MVSRKTSEGERPSFAPRVSLRQIESITRPLPETWGPPPLHPFLFEEQQSSLLQSREAQTRESIPTNMPEPLAQLTVDQTGTRFVGRMMANYDNLASAQRLDAPLTPNQKIIINRGLRGTANPAELTYGSDVIKARGVALGSVTVPFGVNVEHIEPMRESIDDTLRLFGGTVLDRTPVFSIKDVYRAGRTERGEAFGLLMTRKRNIGQVARHIWFRERSSFILRLDAESGISPELRHMLKAMIGRRRVVDGVIDPTNEFHAEIDTYLENDAFETAIPLAITAYKYDELIMPPARPHAVPADQDKNWRKESPNVTMELTRAQLRNAGVPVDDENIMHKLPLARLIGAPDHDD